MKRGKDDEKVMGPMFPRLHVNDKEKGGPRAPPRNKMALYEQLSIPSQRFNPGVLPLNPSNTSNFVPPGSSSQGSGLERNSIFPLHLQPDGANMNTPSAQFEQRKKVGDEDDFTVPVFVHSGIGQCQIKTQNGIDREKLIPFSPTYSGRSIMPKNVFDKDSKQNSSAGLNLRQEARSQSEENPKVCLSNRGHSVKSTINLSVSEKIGGHVKEASTCSNQEHSVPAANFSRFRDNNGCLQQESGAESQPDSMGCGNGVESTRDIEEGAVPWSINSYRSGGSQGSQPDNDSADNDSAHLRDNTCESFQLGNEDKGDDFSEASMVDSISGSDISPDDVVGVIGQKHFWKARRAIVNQQRVFAVQVFELHRLIKVQQLIAESPHLLLEHNAYLGKPPLKSSPAKKLLSEYVVKPQPHIAKRKGDSEKPSYRMECSAENAVGKTSLSSMKSGSQPSNYGPYLRNPPPTPVATDAKMTSWCSQQSPGHQWLIPVMSPSEGLVYKPYPGPGFLEAVCGGCGPLGPTPLTGNFMNPAYGIPAHPHHQGIGVLPGAPPVGRSYFPPYGMPVMNPAIYGSAVEPMNQFPGPGSHGQTGQLSGGGANFNMRHQSSCNVPTQKGGAIPQAMEFQESKDAEIQGSTASSSGERVQGDGMGNAAGGRDALQLFPVAPIIVEGAPQLHDTDHPTRVIKVVPHNPRSATESAARIFRFIQEERKQYE